MKECTSCKEQFKKETMMDTINAGGLLEYWCVDCWGQAAGVDKFVVEGMRELRRGRVVPTGKRKIRLIDYGRL